MERIKQIVSEIALFDLVVVIVGILIFYFELNSKFSPPLSYLIYKATLVSLGFVHARITRIIVYGKIDWNNDEQKMKKILAIVLYAVFIIAYSMGG